MHTILCLAALVAAPSLPMGVPPGAVKSSAVSPTKAQEVQEEVQDTGLSLKEMQRVAHEVGASEIIILKPSSTKSNQWILMEGVGLGVERSAEDMLTVYTDLELRDGLWLFYDGGTIINEHGFVLTLDEATLVIAGSEHISAPIEEQFVTGGGVECGVGYYTCCGPNQHNQWRAKCIPNGDEPPGGEDFPTECTNGGHRATGCTNGGSRFFVYEP